MVGHRAAKRRPAASGPTLAGVRVTTSQIRIAATRSRVWAVVTEPALVRQWQYGSELETDWTVGSPIRFTAEWQGATLEQWGTVLEAEAPERLAYSLFAPAPGRVETPENTVTMRYLLEAVEDGTLLTIVQEDPRIVPADGGGDVSAGAPEEEGESSVLGALKALAESAPGG